MQATSLTTRELFLPSGPRLWLPKNVISAVRAVSRIAPVGRLATQARAQQLIPLQGRRWCPAADRRASGQRRWRARHRGYRRRGTAPPEPCSLAGARPAPARLQLARQHQVDATGARARHLHQVGLRARAARWTPAASVRAISSSGTSPASACGSWSASTRSTPQARGAAPAPGLGPAPARRQRAAAGQSVPGRRDGRASRR